MPGLLWHAGSGFTLLEWASRLFRKGNAGMSGDWPTPELCPCRQHAHPLLVCRTRGSVTEVSTTNRVLVMHSQKPVSSVYPCTIYITYCAQNSYSFKNCRKSWWNPKLLPKQWQNEAWNRMQLHFSNFHNLIQVISNHYQCTVRENRKILYLRSS